MCQSVTSKSCATSRVGVRKSRVWPDGPLPQPPSSAGLGLSSRHVYIGRQTPVTRLQAKYLLCPRVSSPSSKAVLGWQQKAESLFRQTASLQLEQVLGVPERTSFQTVFRSGGYQDSGQAPKPRRLLERPCVSTLHTFSWYMCGLMCEAILTSLWQMDSQASLSKLCSGY
jgi:hypothetical protein